MEPLKNAYNDAFFNIFTEAIMAVQPDFPTKEFISNIYAEGWTQLELKERMRRVSLTMKRYFPRLFSESCLFIFQVIEELEHRGAKGGFEYMFLPDFVEINGLEEYETSVAALERITQFVTGEFAVRPFLIKYAREMEQQMQAWSKHEHPMVRRLSTEGFRPRLPWGMGISRLKKDPSPIVPILERLKNDDSESVRRSVANNLNDISKDHPDLVLELAKKWLGKTPETDWVVKHGCRTLLKAGNQAVMELFGFGSIEEIEVTDFEVLTPKVRIGQTLAFRFKLMVKTAQRTKIRAEYGLYYLKANGSLSRKVFKISEKEYEGNSSTEIEKAQSFKIITTRKFYVGEHALSIILNGVEVSKLGFELIP